MGEESSMVLTNEFDAWDQHVGQYEFAYAFIRVRDALKEREWINSFGEIVLERASGCKTLFVFFSDLDLSIVEKILEDNVRTFKKDRAALEVLLQAWTQSCDEKREITNLVAGAENAMQIVASEPVESGEPAEPNAHDSQNGPDLVAELSESTSSELVIAADSPSHDQAPVHLNLQNISLSENREDEKAYYQQWISQLSLTLAEALVAADDGLWTERALSAIKALTDSAAQQGRLALFQLFQRMEAVLARSIAESLSPDLTEIEVLRDSLAVARQMLGGFDPTDESPHGTGQLRGFLQTLRPSLAGQVKDAHRSAADEQSALHSRALHAIGNLRVDSIRLGDFRDELFGKKIERQVESQLTGVVTSITKHCFDLQQTFCKLTNQSIDALISDYRNNDLFCSATEAFFASTCISGAETLVPDSAAAIVKDCFDHVIAFLRRLEAVEYVSSNQKRILEIDFRKTSHDVLVSFSVVEDCSLGKAVCQQIIGYVSERCPSIRVSAAGSPLTVVSIAIPVQTMTSHNLLVESRGEQIALCSRSLVETGCVAKESIQKVGNKRFVPFREGVIPLASLQELLGLRALKKNASIVSKSPWITQSDVGEKLEYVVSKVAGEFIAFEVDAVCGQREMVVRPLSPIVPRFNGLLGASVIDSERVALVVDTAQVYDMKGVKQGEYARKVS